MNDYSSTGNVNPDQIRASMLKMGRRKVGKGSFRTAIGQQAHHSLPSQAIARVVGAGKSPYAPRSKANVGQSIAGSAATRGQQAKSLYKNPVIARRVPLDTSQVDDRRPKPDQAGGAIPIARGTTRETFGYRNPQLLRETSASRKIAHDIGRSVAHSTVGASSITHDKTKKLPWGWSMPGGLAGKPTKNTKGGK